MGEVVQINAPHLARFPIGLTVMHVTQGRGVVHSHIEGNVVVKFDNIQKGKHVVGAYDAKWFAMYPRFLLAHTENKKPQPEPPPPDHDNVRGNF